MKVISLAAASLLVLAIQTVDAQTAEEIRAAAQEDRRQQRQLDERARSKDLDQRVQPPPQYQVPDQPQAVTQPDIGSRNCLLITRVELYGADNLSRFSRYLLTRDYLNQCLGITQMQQLAKDITNYYLKKGYATTRASLRVPQYAAKNGVLEINVVEGRLQEFVFSPDSNKLAREAFIAFPISERDVFHLGDVDQGVAQIGRMDLQQPTIAVEPGDSVGSSKIIYSNPSDKNTILSATYNNYGNRSTGKDILSLDLEGQSWFGMNERIFANHTQSIPSKASGNTLSKKIGIDIGFGYWLAYYHYAESAYLTTIKTGNASIETSGKTVTTKGSLERTFHRSKSNLFKLSLSLEVLDKRNYIEGVLIEVSTRRLAHMYTNLTWDHFYSTGYVSFDLGWSKGLEGFDAVKDPGDLQEYEPRAQDEITTIGVTLVQKIWSPVALRYQMSAQGQKAEMELYSERQFSIGGHSSVRGYKTNGVAEEQGWYVRNTLSGKPFLLTPSRHPALDGLELGVFYDAGETRSVYKKTDYYLAGYGYLASWRWKVFSFNYTREIALHHPDLYTKKEGWIDRAELRVRVGF